MTLNVKIKSLVVRNLLSAFILILLTACGTKYSTEVGLTSTTYNKKFTKNTANNYVYKFNADDITYTDSDGEKVDLSDERKQQIVENVNQCLSDAGYSNQSKDGIKNIVLNLQFTEKITEDEELFYGQAMAEKYPNYDYFLYEEKGVGPQNRSVIPYGLAYASDTLLQNRHAFSKKNYSETLFNYVGADKIYYVMYPYYSKYAGLENSNTKISTNCQRRYSPAYKTLISTELDAFSCYVGTTNLSNFYATLTGNIDNDKQFQTTLHYKANFIKKENDLDKTRDYVVDFLSKNICLFITDNVEDLGIKFLSKDKDRGLLLSSDMIKYQIIKNKSNQATGNYYSIKNKITGESFTNTERSGVFKGDLYQPDGVYIDTGCPLAGEKTASKSGNFSVSITDKSECYQNLRLSKMNVSVDDIEVKNNLRKDNE